MTAIKPQEHLASICPAPLIRRLNFILFGGLAAALLSACAAKSTPGPVDDVGSRVDRTPAPSTSAAVLAPKPPKTETARLAPLPAIEASALMAYSREALVSALGSPVFQRRDKDAEMLRFQGQGCVLNVYLYPDASGPAGPDGKTAGGTPRIAHVEARDTQGTAMDRQACLNRTPRDRTG